jgi:hypothetical protein
VDNPDFRWTDWAKSQVYLEDGLSSNRDQNKVAFEKLSSVILKVLAESNPNSCPRDDPQSLKLACIQDEIA